MLDSLFILPAGRLPPNPAELLASPRMDRLLAQLRDRYDAIILDSPPVLAVTDSAVLGTKTDGVILVVRAEKTEKDAIALALQQMRQVKAHVLGIVVNDARSDGVYQSFYREYYGQRKSSGLRGLIERLQGSFS
jgi:capsular exopolysaccharide synthesis family protein